MTLHELNLTKAALNRQLTELNRIKPGCNSCTRYQGGVCDHFNAAPPDSWVAGPIECEQWQFDGIPF